MSKLRVYYAKMPNMGDLLNEYIIPRITDMEVEHCENVSKFQVMGIGSCGGAVWTGKADGLNNQLKDTIKKFSSKSSTGPCAVWGTGFFEDLSDQDMKLVRNSTDFIAVRGNRSKAIVEKMLNKKLDIPVCDGGILTDVVLDEVEEKKYEIGLIPHFREQDFIKENGILEVFKSKYPKLKIIDLKADPIEVIKEIAQCEYIVSSSLHGCVVADSFYIPNMPVEFSDIPGTGFKFLDYYSGFNVDMKPILIKDKAGVPELSDISDNYKLTNEMIDTKKDEMKKALVDFCKKL